MLVYLVGSSKCQVLVSMVNISNANINVESFLQRIFRQGKKKFVTNGQR